MTMYASVLAIEIKYTPCIQLAICTEILISLCIGRTCLSNLYPASLTQMTH